MVTFLYTWTHGVLGWRKEGKVEAGRSERIVASLVIRRLLLLRKRLIPETIHLHSSNLCTSTTSMEPELPNPARPGYPWMKSTSARSTANQPGLAWRMPSDQVWPQTRTLICNLFCHPSVSLLLLQLARSQSVCLSLSFLFTFPFEFERWSHANPHNRILAS